MLLLPLPHLLLQSKSLLPLSQNRITSGQTQILLTQITMTRMTLLTLLTLLLLTLPQLQLSVPLLLPLLLPLNRNGITSGQMCSAQSRAVSTQKEGAKAPTQGLRLAKLILLKSIATSLRLRHGLTR